MMTWILSQLHHFLAFFESIWLLISPITWSLWKDFWASLPKGTDFTVLLWRNAVRCGVNRFRHNYFLCETAILQGRLIFTFSFYSLFFFPLSLLCYNRKKFTLFFSFDTFRGKHLFKKQQELCIINARMCLRS